MKIALVLGSGGARGYAHIGVIEELTARGHEVVAVSGASMGALVGGLYAAGAMDRFTQTVRGMSRTEVLRFADLTLTQPGLLRATKIVGLLEDLVGDQRIEDLPIPYTAVATDIERRREVWFHEGLLVPAIRASISIPTVFTPVRLGGRLLVDGGVLNPLPIEPSLSQEAELIVGVSLFGRRLGLDPSSPDREAAATEPERWIDRLPESLRQLIPGRVATESKPATPSVTLADMLSTTLDVMQGQIELGRSAMSRPDVMISVPIETCRVTDFQEADRVIEVGRDLAREAFDTAGL
ncbi:patatin-like phospholipase family protein [Actinomyces urogenitalis]|uniref:patatin-like phospholipase family protein n=1 Tax=Actinomyces urogenitalis TaxID=103621 RepID=UPI00050E974F|nr:patatin-like phospholipase family protein [Actinomyces urogenitalis]KGF00177.1 hypothetical protein HMPREF1626_08080 [Actinomyces urogenitalis S6-C4]MCI7456462.1 patatin-like phospholipase family protein [Actinomyces urogenitalis]MDK8237738.1 patatin-like phospholipase family protein [Actinomyces urogenitalis]MDU0863676.1 patatin-like phospholipase family protein [Actinomyces urogenitalis]MDU0874290.1 patatin-like phospholipase family protein [Actinomyces urogenitalis]